MDLTNTARKRPIGPHAPTFPSPPRTTEPPHLHIVSRAQRETTKSKHIHPNSPRPLDYPRRWVRVSNFRSEALLCLPVSTTSYSQHAVSTIQTRSAVPTTVWSLIDTNRAKTIRNPVLLPYPTSQHHSLPDLQFHSFHLYSSDLYIKI